MSVMQRAARVRLQKPKLVSISGSFYPRDAAMNWTVVVDRTKLTILATVGGQLR